jgi:hypothetical protein
LKKLDKFVILDLSKDLDIELTNSIIYQISYGNVKTKKCKYIKKNFFSEKNFIKYQNNLNTELLKFFNQIKNSSNNFELLEIFNQRNDKIKLYNKIYYFLALKKFILLQKFKIVKIYTDDKYFLNIYKSIRSKNVEVIDLSKKNKKNIFIKYFLSSIYFFIKTFLFLLIIKLFKSNKKIQYNKKICLSLYPNFYVGNKEKFFDKKFLKLNFQITDETHLSNSLLKNILTFLKLRKIDNIIIAEEFIQLKELFTYLTRSINNLSVLFKISKYQFKIDNNNFTSVFFGLFAQSLLNYNKLFIYENVFYQLSKKFRYKEFHYYMFEYNFGYFLNKCIKNYFPKAKLLGYQHGIYSERVMWQNFTNLLGSNFFSPHEIICKYKISRKAYSKNFQKVKITLKEETYNSKKKIKTKKFLKNVVFLGLHDGYDIINFLRNLEKKFFFKIKIHPKMKFKNILKLKNNFDFKTNTNDILHKSKIILSPTSTMAYQFHKAGKKFKIAVPNNHIPLSPKILDTFIIKNNKL